MKCLIKTLTPNKRSVNCHLTGIIFLKIGYPGMRKEISLMGGKSLLLYGGKITICNPATSRRGMCCLNCLIGYTCTHVKSGMVFFIKVL